MPHIVKSNSHNNNLAVWEHSVAFNKIALTKEGNTAIMREKQGYDWFGVEVALEKYDDGRLSLTIPKYKGKTFPQYNCIKGNEQWITKLVETYKEKWGKGQYAVHGDLCLCNVIFSGQGKTHIIDWEHFHYTDRRYYGFDIVHMIFIQLHYEYRWLAKLGINWASWIDEGTIRFIRRTILSLETYSFSEFPFKIAQTYINNYMNRDKFILGNLKPHIIGSLDLMFA